MKRTSKYLHKRFDNWVCTHVGISRVQSKKTRTGKPSNQPGRQSYYYIFERLTSDGIAEKMVRLSAAEAAKVYQGKLTVEEIAEERHARSARKNFATKISYHFIDGKHC
jgi:hypothetical protein